jgi:hypothetical protein
MEYTLSKIVFLFPVILRYESKDPSRGRPGPFWVVDVPFIQVPSGWIF